MELIVTRDAETFAQKASGYLAERPERNVLATVLANSASGIYGNLAPVFAVGIDEADGSTVAAAIRTPPWAILADGFATSHDAQGLLECWLPIDPEPPGVSGQPATARAICAAFSAQTGGASELDVSEAIHRLSAVTPPPRPARGRARPATLKDRDTLIEWDRAFVLEARMGHVEEAERRVDHRLATGRQFVWVTDDDIPVSTVGFNANVAGSQRIGPVYTPPEHRGRGYATHAVAATSRQLLDQGAEQCILFTDLANPTSNKIYASIGYERFADWEEHRFLPG